MQQRPGFNYNVSHHGGVVALASEPIALVGLDIMHLGHRPGEALINARRERWAFNGLSLLSEYDPSETHARIKYAMKHAHVCCRC